LVTDLRGLPGGRLAFARADPRLGVLGADGREAWARGPATADYRGQTGVAVSADGARVALRHDRWDGAGRRWDAKPMSFSLAERRLAAGPAPAGLATARTEAPGFKVEGWKNGTEPALNGARLALDPFEFSRSLAVAPDGERFVLGADWWLRLFGRDGRELWEQATSGAAWAVNVTGDGRLVVVGLRRRHDPLAPALRRGGSCWRSTRTPTGSAGCCGRRGATTWPRRAGRTWSAGR
jgi:hypothetical protein